MSKENNDVIDNLKKNIEDSPLITYSSELLNEAINNTNKKIEDNNKVNIVDDFVAIFPLSVSLTLLIVILILIYISFF